MAETCSTCGSRLPFLRRLTGRSLCQSCEAEERKAVKSARERYEALLSELTASSVDPAHVQPQLPQLAESARLHGSEVKRLHLQAYRSCIEDALEDDYITVDEEKRINEIANVLDVGEGVLDGELSDLKVRIFVARANDGRLPTLESPHIMLKKDEVAHLETEAALTKEVVDREMRGGYGGVSFRVAKGVRFHTGGVRGKSVVTGTHLEVADTGILTVTSKRAVYTGQRQSIEMPYTKLLGLQVFNDGIQLHLSNRKKPPLFRLGAGLGSAVAAAINAVCQEQPD